MCLPSPEDLHSRSCWCSTSPNGIWRTKTSRQQTRETRPGRRLSHQRAAAIIAESRANLDRREERKKIDETGHITTQLYSRLHTQRVKNSQDADTRGELKEQSCRRRMKTKRSKQYADAEWPSSNGPRWRKIVAPKLNNKSSGRNKQSYVEYSHLRQGND